VELLISMHVYPEFLSLTRIQARRSGVASWPVQRYADARFSTYASASR
jgi:hypothetical protein